MMDLGLFGVPDQGTHALFQVLMVPFEGTVSYRLGTKRGPLSILQASTQVDLFDIQVGEPHLHGFHVTWLHSDNQSLHQSATHQFASQALKQHQIPIVIGGEHSVPLGSIQAYAQHFPHMGILHIDAHCDLRAGYEGFTHSHASIFYHVYHTCPSIPITQVGIRDFCKEEYDLVKQSQGRIQTFFDAHLDEYRLKGRFEEAIAGILKTLPKQVYISFDIDGLSPDLCPHTGTPVPGGLQWHEVMGLLKALIDSGRTIVGFDLCEVAPNPKLSESELYTSFDACVGARVLYKLCGFTAPPS